MMPVPAIETATIHHLLLVLDLVGTAVFAISGAMLGVRSRFDVFGVLMLAFVASSAGGIVRDLLVARAPVVLHRDLYAMAALLGAAVVAIGHGLHWPPVPVALSGAALCLTVRLLAIRHDWQLPVAGSPGAS